MGKQLYPSYKEFRQSLKKGVVAPVYLLFGEEEFLLDEAVAALVKVVLGDPVPELDMDVVSFAELSIQEILSRANAYPMGSQRRIVIARDVARILPKAGQLEDEAADSSSPKMKAKGNVEPLIRYVESPLATTCLILIGGEKIDARLKVMKNLLEHAAVYEFRPLYESQVASWIATRIRERGRTMTDEACQLLASYVGSSLQEVQSEMEKLLLYAGEKAAITEDDVANLVGVAREFTIFELQKAIGDKDLGRSLTILERMLNASQSPVLIVTMLTNHFARAWKLKALQQRTRDQNEILRFMEISPFQLRDISRLCETFSLAALENAFRVIADADARLKRSSGDQREILDVMLVQLISGAVGVSV